MVKLQEVKGQFSISVPKELVKEKKWNKGIRLIFRLMPSGIVEVVEAKNQRG
jgi:hypothetical protein